MATLWPRARSAAVVVKLFPAIRLASALARRVPLRHRPALRTTWTHYPMASSAWVAVLAAAVTAPLPARVLALLTVVTVRVAAKLDNGSGPLPRSSTMDALLLTPKTVADTSLPDHEVKKIHIRTRQNGKKWVTLIEGLDDDLDLKRIARAMKSAFHCSAAACVDEDSGGEYIKLSGNQRDLIRAWLVDNEVLTEKEAAQRILLHGA